VSQLFKSVCPVDFERWWGEGVRWWCDRVEDDGDPQKLFSVGKVDGFKVLWFVHDRDVARSQELDELSGGVFVGGVTWCLALVDEPFGE
jgi:hypothetical protein